MAITFPTSFDDFPEPTDTTYEDDTGFEHDLVHDDIADALEVIEGILGITGSAVTTSIEYRLSGVTGGAKAVSTAAIGVTVQAYDAELAALAGLTSAADKVPYFTGSGTAAIADFSSFGRSLVDDADASAGRTTLGLGTIATQNANAVNISGGNISGVNYLRSGGSQYRLDIRGNADTDPVGFIYQSNTFGGAALRLQSADDSQSALEVYDSTGVATKFNVNSSGDITKIRGVTTSWPAANATGVLHNNGSGTFSWSTISGADIGDAELAAIAGLTSAADSLPYFTGSGTAALASFTSTARSLVDDTSTSAMRTTLGLAIGSDVQAYDAELAALAGLTSAANKLPYFTGSGTAAVADFTAAARTVVDDSTVAAMVTTLGLDPIVLVFMHQNYN